MLVIAGFVFAASSGVLGLSLLFVKYFGFCVRVLGRTVGRQERRGNIGFGLVDENATGGNLVNDENDLI